MTTRPAVEPSRITKKLGELPTLPAIYARIAELTAHPETGAADLERVIENDQALASKLLRLVNSAFFGFPVEIRTISRAVMIVGFKSLSQLAMSASVLNLFPEGEEEVLDYRSFWSHAIGTAVLTRRIAIERNLCSPEEVFLGGLLHDIGILAHARVLPDEFSEILSLARERDLFLFEAEREVLGFDHTATGQALAEQWRLPRATAQAVVGHHAPSRAAEPTDFTAIVHVACALCTAAGIGQEGVDLVPPLDPAAWDRVGLPPHRVPQVLEGIEGEVSVFMEMIDS